MKKRIIRTVFSISIVFLLTACSGASSEEGILSPEEMEATRLEMELTEGVLVDAAITPYSRYENGLSAYYVSMEHGKRNLVTEEEFTASPLIYGYSVEEFAQLLAEQSGFSPEYTWEVTFGSEDIIGNMIMCDQAGIERTLWCGWLMDEEDRVESEPNVVYYNYEWDSFDHNAVCNLLSDAVPNESELDFASSEELAAQAEKILTTLTGEEYYSEVICVPMGETNRQKLKDKGYRFQGDLADSNSPYLEEDYYGYIFYRDIDGFPLRYLCPSITLRENTVWDEELDVQIHGDSLMPLIADKQFVSWGETGGLRYLSTDRKPCIMEAYKEKESVCDINRILENAKQYFDSILLPAAVTVNRIEIAYSYWFSDAEDGPLRNIAAPFWVVQYWNPASEMQMMLIFDAFSGQLISQPSYQP